MLGGTKNDFCFLPTRDNNVPVTDRRRKKRSRSLGRSGTEAAASRILCRVAADPKTDEKSLLSIGAKTQEKEATDHIERKREHGKVEDMDGEGKRRTFTNMAATHHVLAFSTHLLILSGVDFGVRKCVKNVGLLLRSRARYPSPSGRFLTHEFQTRPQNYSPLSNVWLSFAVNGPYLFC